MIYAELFLQGLVQGSIYALIALGLTLVYGLLRILHVAHAALFTLGAYIGVLVSNASGSLTLALLCAMLTVGLLGMLMYRWAYQPLLQHPPYVALIASIGLYIAAEELFRLVFGPYGLSYQAPPLQTVITLGNSGIILTQAELAVMIGSLLALLVLHILATRTRLGLAWRATVTDPQMAESFGINIQQVRYINFFIGSALAAAAGVMVALLNNLVEPGMGSVPSYKALAIIVLGGLGNVRGALLAALTLGVIEAFGTIYLDAWLDRDAIAFAFLILVLMWRPHGLLGKAG
ncbi:MAG: branched-chain amino acid ABC transporter permease [Gammaproteobacteria bacterium]